MIASLPMYQRPELVDAHNEFWQLIRKNLSEKGINSPAELSQDTAEMTTWLDPDLVLSQTCGMPYRTFLHDKVTLVGTPDFGVENCPEGFYRSAFVIHKSKTGKKLIDFKDKLFTYNDPISQSGYAAPYHETQKHHFFFENKTQSGAHLQSARMVAEQKADIAAIDAVSLSFMEEYEDFYNELHILSWTDPTPSLPYITSLNNHSVLFFDAISNAIQALSPYAARKLKIKQIVKISPKNYLSIPNPDL